MGVMRGRPGVPIQQRGTACTSSSRIPTSITQHSNRNIVSQPSQITRTPPQPAQCTRGLLKCHVFPYFHLLSPIPPSAYIASPNHSQPWRCPHPRRRHRRRGNQATRAPLSLSRSTSTPLQAPGRRVQFNHCACARPPPPREASAPSAQEPEIASQRQAKLHVDQK